MLEFLLVHVVNLRMGFQEIVSAQIARNAGIVERRCHVVQAVRLLAHVPRFVESRPHLDAIAELIEEDSCVVGEDVDQLGIGPASELLESLWKLEECSCN